MIIGIGIDMVRVDRIEKSLRREAFRTRNFTVAELASVEVLGRPEEHLAGKFAVKEAMMKAIGQGIQQGLWFSQIEVVNTEDGEPMLQLSGLARDRSAELGVRRTHVSISHTDGYALGVVILED